MDRKSLYLDTSVPCAYYDEKGPERQELTKEFWKKLKDQAVFISRVTIQELEKDRNEEKRMKTLSLIEGFSVLEPSSESETLAASYVENGIIPEKFKEDAQHIVIATLNEVDFLVSRHFKHLVNVKTREKVKALNTLKDYKSIEIIAPPKL